MKLTKAIARKVLQTVDAGLSAGLGKQKPGEMCIEAAVCYALGEPHGDNPSCVGSAVRAYKIALNDSWPGTPKQRAEGMRRLAIAQLGSDRLDQTELSKRLAVATVNQILPFVVKDAKLKKACQEAKTVAEAHAATAAAYADAAYAAYAATAYAAAYAATAAAYAADAAYAAYAEAAAADTADATEVFRVAAEMTVQILVDMKSPGAKWLDLCDEVAS